MRYLYCLMIMAGAGVAMFTSCDKEDEPWQNATSGNVWKPQVEALVTSANSIRLKWSPPPYNRMMILYPDVEPTEFEVFRSGRFDQGYEKVAEVENREGNYDLSFSGLQENTPCYFYITASRKGFETISSDTLMAIPAVAPESEILFRQIGIRQLAFSSQLNKLAYVVPGYEVNDNNTNSATTLIMSDPDGLRSEALIANGTYPSWSATGDTLFFTHYDPAPANGNGNGKEQQAILNLENKEVTLLTGDPFARWGTKFNPTTSQLLYQAYFLDQSSNSLQLRLLVLDTQTQTEHDVVDENFFSLRSINKVAWRTEQQVLFDLWNYSGKYQIYQADLTDGKPALLLPEEWDGMAPSVSPDGTHMAFVASRTGSYQIWLYNFKDNTFRMLTGYTGDEYIVPGTTTIEWYDAHSILFVLNEEKVTRLKIR